jgi:hypothetical protein
MAKRSPRTATEITSIRHKKDNGESFFVRHAYFTGGDQPYEKLGLHRFEYSG